MLVFGFECVLFIFQVDIYINSVFYDSSTCLVTHISENHLVITTLRSMICCIDAYSMKSRSA
jgi:hypothetical protein